MKKSRFSEEQIVRVLKEVDGGSKPQDVCRRLGINDQTLYNRRRNYVGREVSEVRRLKTLDDENKKCSRFSDNRTNED